MAVNDAPEFVPLASRQLELTITVLALEEAAEEAVAAAAPINDDGEVTAVGIGSKFVRPNNTPRGENDEMLRSCATTIRCQ